MPSATATPQKRVLVPHGSGKDPWELGKQWIMKIGRVRIKCLDLAQLLAPH